MRSMCHFKLRWIIALSALAHAFAYGTMLRDAPSMPRSPKQRQDRQIATPTPPRNINTSKGSNYKLPVETRPPDARPYPYGPKALFACRTSRGMIYTSDTPGYQDCLDEPTFNRNPTSPANFVTNSRAIFLSW